MRLVKFKDMNDREIEVNPAAVSYIYSSGKGTGMVFGAQHANPVMLPLPRDVVHRRLKGLDGHDAT